jgi:ribonucleotide reductase beta subunit family protein with ferritin-like domain
MATPQFNLATDPDNTYTCFPILNMKYYKLYKEQLASFWTTEEIDLSKDHSDYENKLTGTERQFVRNILAFFAASDGIVAENLDLNFTEEIPFKEVRTCLRYQAMMEDIHSEMYSKMIDVVISDKTEKLETLNAIKNIPCIKKKAAWALKWTHPSTHATLAHRLIAFACVEGIHFSGSFCAIFWLKKRNLMPGFTLSNEFIARDEGKHTETSVALYLDLLPQWRLNKNEVYDIIHEAITIEQEFITDSIPCSMLGMNCDLMRDYVEYIGDRLLVQLGYPKRYGKKNPFDFMETISMETKTNFFESTVTSYAKSGVSTSSNSGSGGSNSSSSGAHSRTGLHNGGAIANQAAFSLSSAF